MSVAGQQSEEDADNGIAVGGSGWGWVGNLTEKGRERAWCKGAWKRALGGVDVLDLQRVRGGRLA